MATALDPNGERPVRATKSAPKIEEDYVMVASIDFGTTFSGYAFSFKGSETDIKLNKNWGDTMGFSVNKQIHLYNQMPIQRFHLRWMLYLFLKFFC